jgi:hypothetical protein
MTRRATPPFRADHVGSLLRPLTIDQERAKLELLVETAREVWG